MSDDQHQGLLGGKADNYELAELRDLAGEEEEGGVPFAYASLLAPADSHTFASDDDAEADNDLKLPRQGSNNKQDDVHDEAKLVPQWRMAILGLCQFGFSALQAFLFAILLPLQTLDMVGKENKGTALGAGLAVATVVSTVLSLVAGQVSDRINTVLGKRTPFVVVGSLGFALSAVVLVWYGDAGLEGAGAYVVWAGIMVVSLTLARVSESSFQPLLPDLVPKQQMGTVSGWWAMGQMTGNLFGAAGTSFIMNQTGPVVITIIIATTIAFATLVNTLANREKPAPPAQPLIDASASDEKGVVTRCTRWPALRFLASFINPFVISANFRWIFATRFVTQLGYGFINNFAFFFITDVSPRPFRIFSLEFTNTNDAVGIFLGTIMLVAIFSGYVGGALCDRFGRKRMVYVSSALQSLACLGFVSFAVWPQQFTFVIVYSVIMGMGLGAYIAVDFALATECMPSEKTRGTDLAVWGLSSSLPITIAGPLGGLMLDNGQRVGHLLSLPNLGYTALFGSCSFLLMLSAALVMNITVGNPIKPKPSRSGFALVEMEDDLAPKDLP